MSLYISTRERLVAYGGIEKAGDVNVRIDGCILAEVDVRCMAPNTEENYVAAGQAMQD